MKINKFAPESSSYFQILSNIAKKPKQLFYTGTLPPERRPTIAIVGTRKPTPYGKEVTEQFASALARHGVIIVSGLALGVDGVAHRAAIAAQGTTLAVLGNGLPNIYPASHRSLADEIIASGGALLTEYPPGSPALPHQFLERNRLVSGIADIVLITEAALRSGTMSTATHALEQGKDVFVVPGNITSPMSGGCNNLLKQGAMPATDPRDILELLIPITSTEQASLAFGTTPEEQAVVQLLRQGIRDGDHLCQQSQLDPTVFSQTLTMLELNGIIKSLGANQWTLR